MLLEVEGVTASYGAVQAIDGVSLSVEPGEAVALVGANGAGKSTTLKAISGLVKLAGGRVRFDGADLGAQPAYRIAELGIAHVPEGRRVFADLTVRENLSLGGYAPRARSERAERIARVFELFPRLKERQHQRAGTLSGGEQQMLAIGRGLMLGPKLIMLDEPSLGLAPRMVEVAYEGIARIHAQGVAVLLVEQNVPRALSVAHHAYVVQTGRIAVEGPGEALLGSELVRRAYLGL